MTHEEFAAARDGSVAENTARGFAWILPGVRFDTLVETGCVATSKVGPNRMFDGLDSDGVECTFHAVMAIPAAVSS